MPGQQLCDARDWRFGDVGEHMTQIGFGVEAVQFGAADEGVDGGGAFAAGIGAGEQVELVT